MPFWKNGKKFGLSVNGTPSDCVKLAVSALLESKPDLIVSGINHGQNTSVNVIYSGTVSAATEGMLLGIPSIAFSLANFSYKADFSSAEEYAYLIAKNVLRTKIPSDTLINVNIPDLPLEQIKGIKITRQSNSIWEDYYEKREDPFGREYYWFSGNYKIIDNDIEADDVALSNGFVSITPLRLNMTNDKFIKKLKNFEKLRL
jgi:5'-nucleotidase